MAEVVMGIVGIGALVCWIMTLIKMFNFDSVGKGIFGIICGLYAFIWGWQHADAHKHKNIMIVWTICIILSLGSNFLLLK